MGLKYVRAPWVTFWDSDDQGNPREVIAAVSKANTKSKVLIGGYRVMNLENQTYSKLLTPDANLSKLMMNPGGWRFIFRRDFIGEVRFPSTAMGEDQIFLARLKIQARDIELVNECFYTYFVGSSTQLTKKSESVVELKESILELENLIIQNPIVEKYIYVINARMAITAFKKRVYSGVDLAKYVFGDAELTWRKRLNWIAGFLKVINFRILRSGPGLC
jgi:hypothetical protein